MGYPRLHLDLFPSPALCLAYAKTAQSPSDDRLAVFAVRIPLFFALIDLVEAFGAFGRLDMCSGEMGMSQRREPPLGHLHGVHPRGHIRDRRHVRSVLRGRARRAQGRCIGLGVGLERAGDALPYGLGFFALLPASLGAQESFLLALVLAQQEFFDFAYAHACANPPPPAEEALPECDGPHELGHPRVLVLSWDVEKVEHGGDDGEDDGACAKDGGSAVCAPGLTTIDKEAPDEEKGGEEEGEGSVADVAGVCCEARDGGAIHEGQELHCGGDDGEWPWMGDVGRRWVSKDGTTYREDQR